MTINIFEEKFLEVNEILLVKNHLKRLSEFRVTSDSLSGSIFIDLNYYDKNMQENFKTLEIPYAIIIKDEMKIDEVILSTLSLEMVEMKGVVVKYNLDINYSLIEDNVIEELDDQKEELVNPIINENIDVISEANKTEEIENNISTSLKDSLKEEYDSMLDQSLNSRSMVSTIVPSDYKTEDDFLTFFNNFQTNNLKIKKIFVNKENISKYIEEYHLDDKQLSDMYDEDTQILTIQSYE